MKNVFKMILCGSLGVLLMTGCTAKETVPETETMEAETSNAISFDFIGGKNVMPIAGYYGPYTASYSEDGQTPPDYITEEYWKMIADCGINLMSYSPLDYAYHSEEVMKNLEYGEKYHVAVVVTDSSVENMANEDEISMDALTQRLSEYINHPAFAGVYMIDEPCTEYYIPAGAEAPEHYLDYYGKLTPILNQTLDMFTYTNANPSSDGHKEYERYIRDFAETLQPKYLQFDRYPFDAGNRERMDLYFYDMAIVRKVAQEKNLPFWSFIQAGSQWNDKSEYFDSVTPYYPSEGEMDWSVNVSLAFGAQGINYFPLIEPYHFAFAKSTTFDLQRNGLIGAWGNKNQWYYYAQNLSVHIRAIDEVLMNSVNKGVLACGKQAEQDVYRAKEYGAVLAGTSWRELKAVEGDALIGCFNYLGKTALYVVNYSTEYSQEIRLTFHEKSKVTVIQSAETKYCQGESMALDMFPGEGVLLVFE